MSLIPQAYAQEICNPVLPWTCGQSGGSLLGTIISSTFAFIIVLAGLFSFFFLLTGGIQWITSGGDKTALENARNRIMHAVIGLILTVSIWAISTFIFNWLGISFPNLSFPKIYQEQPSGGGGTRVCYSDQACVYDLGHHQCAQSGYYCTTTNGGECCKP